MSKKCHFIGIGGIGMSGLARLILSDKDKVSGSDIHNSNTIEELKQQGASVHIGHDAKYVTRDMTVVYSSGIAENNPEFTAAKELSCTMLHRADLLRLLSEGKSLLGVTGTHGKTTTSSLLAHLLTEVGASPSYALGGVLLNSGSNSQKNEGEHFVAELDESDGSFLKFSPYGAIVTNIGSDHIDHYGSKETLIASFRQFLEQVKSEKHLFWCGDNMYLREIAPRGISYGFSEGCHLRATSFEQKGWSLSYCVEVEGKRLPRVELPMIGIHNALNSLAVLGLALSLGIAEEKILAAFKSFRGVKRRAEIKGEHGGVMVVDDYAHHPTEISSSINAIREAIGERKLTVLYQPHRYSRTRDCLGEFGGIFDQADEVVVTEIYAAGENPLPGISHEEIIEENESSSAEIYHVRRDELLLTILQKLSPHDVLLTLGAGDITQLADQLTNALKKKGLEN